MRKMVLNILVVGFILLSLNACSTVAGAGKDLQKAGQVIERKAEKI